MKKFFRRGVALALALVLLMSIAPLSGAYKMPGIQTKKLKLDEVYIDSHDVSGTVKVNLTLDGYLGELDMAEVGIENEIQKACGWSWWYGDTEIDTRRPIYVLKSGSDVKFTITASDPQAYYNFCYDKREFDQYTFDDCGGGCVYRFDDGEMDSSPLFVIPGGDGTAKLNGGTYATAYAKKTGSNSYAYSADDGLYTFCFTAKEKAGEGEFDDNTGGVAKYILGTFLFVSEEQVAELEQSGTMTFHGDYEWTAYQHYYPGLATIFGREEPPKYDDELKIQIIEKTGKLYDNGVYYKYTVTNNTGETFDGYHAFITYDCSEYGYFAQVFPFRTDNLEQGESMELELVSSCWRLSDLEYIVVHFEDYAEKELFCGDKRLLDPYSDGVEAYILQGSVEERRDWMSMFE